MSTTPAGRLADLHVPLATQDLAARVVHQLDQDGVIADLGAPALEPQHQMEARMDRREALDPDAVEDPQHRQLAVLVDDRVVADQRELDVHTSDTRMLVRTSPCWIL